MPTRGIYVRLRPELDEQIRGTAKTEDLSISALVEAMIGRGFEEKRLEEDAERLQRERDAFEAEAQELREANAKMSGQLIAYKAQQSVWQAAQSRAAGLENEVQQLQTHNDQLRNYLQLNVASCRSCGARLRLWDIGQVRCWNCSQWQLAWLESYRPPATTGEALLGALAVAGTALAVVALLGALGGGQSNEGNNRS